MAALAHLPPAALDHSSSPTGPIATKLKDGVNKHHNNDRVKYGGRQTIFRYRIESTTAEGWMTMPFNFDSSGGRLHISSRYSSDLLVILYLSRCQRSQLMDNRGGLEDMGFLGRNNSNTSHKSHRILGITSPICCKAHPNPCHSHSNQTYGVWSQNNSEKAWIDPDYRPLMEWSYHRHRAGSLEPAYLRDQASTRHNWKSIR